MLLLHMRKINASKDEHYTQSLNYGLQNDGIDW